MECTVENDMSPLYNEMKKFNFKKPFSVTIEQVNDSSEGYSIEDTNYGNEKNDNPKVSVYFQEENTYTIKNKENFVMQTDNCDITRFNKTQGSSDLCTPSWISDLLHTKELQYSQKPHTDKNQSISSVSEELSCREGNSSGSFLMSESICSSKSSSVNYHPVSPASVLLCSNRNLSYCDPNFRQLKHKLNFVSLNLINTLRAFSYYLVVVRNQCVTAAKKIDARRKYQTAKNSYFQFCREIVEQEILPQSNNTDFIRNFIKETRRIAIAKNIFCTITDVENVYNDLLAWIFYMRSHETTLNAKQNPQNQITGNSGFPETSPQRQMLQFNGSISNNMDQSECSINERITQGANTCLLSYGSPGNELSISINTEILNNISGQNNLDNLRENNYLNSKCNPDQTKNHQTTNISSNWNSSLTCETLHHDAMPIRQSTTRTTSRDSGFMSPETEQNNTEQIIQEPYITHATSLNPDATYIPPGNCALCGRLTSTKCLGCFNFYYCSNNCQSLHWTRHKNDCKISVR